MSVDVAGSVWWPPPPVALEQVSTATQPGSSRATGGGGHHTEPLMCLGRSHWTLKCVETLQAKDHAGGVGENSRWSSASRDTRVVAQLVAARTPPDRREPPNVSSRRDEGFVEPGSYVSATPSGVVFSIVTVPVVFAPPRFSRRLRCSVRRSTTGYSPSHLRRDPLPQVSRLHGHPRPGSCTKDCDDGNEDWG